MRLAVTRIEAIPFTRVAAIPFTDLHLHYKQTTRGNTQTTRVTNRINLFAHVPFEILYCQLVSLLAHFSTYYVINMEDHSVNADIHDVSFMI